MYSLFQLTPIFLHLENNVTIVNATYYELNKSMNQCFENPVATLP